MKLELKHLTYYLPYGLKMICLNYYEEEDIPYQKWLLSSLSVNDFDNRELDEWWNEQGDNFYVNSEFKPILRPLSDLTKEIEVNGEKFIPTEKLSVHLFDWDFIDYVVNRKHTEGIPFWVIQKILEWNFDIFGLIPQELAIDINRIN